MKRIVLLSFSIFMAALQFGVNATNGVTRYIVLSSDKGFAEQVTQPNTIYEVRNDFDLMGKRAIIPEGCSLVFMGGIIESGTILGNGTEIIAGKRIIFDLVKLEGSWNVDMAYPEWFGAKGDGLNDDSNAIQACIDAPFSKIVFQNRATAYTVSKPIVVNRPVIIDGEYGFGPDTYAKIQASKKIETLFYLMQGCVRSSFSHLYLDGNNKSVSGFYSPQGKNESYLYMNSFINIKVVFTEYGFRLNKLYSCVFTSCQCNSISKIGFCFNKDLTDGSEGTTITAINCGSSTWHSKGGIGWYFNKLSYCNLISCGSDQNNVAYEFNNCSNFSVIGCGCEQSGTPVVFDYNGYSSGFTISSFRISDLNENAPYDWLFYSGGLYNTTIAGIYLNTKNKRAGDIYTRYAGSSITVLDNTSISPLKCTLSGKAVLFPLSQITNNAKPGFEGQIQIDNSHIAVANNDGVSLAWKTIYNESLNTLDWSNSNTLKTSGGYREFEKVVFLDAHFSSNIGGNNYKNVAVNLPENALGETFLRITDSDGSEESGVIARVSSTILQVSGLKKGKSYYITGYYFRK